MKPPYCFLVHGLEILTHHNGIIVIDYTAKNLNEAFKHLRRSYPTLRVQKIKPPKEIVEAFQRYVDDSTPSEDED